MLPHFALLEERIATIKAPSGGITTTGVVRSEYEE